MNSKTKKQIGILALQGDYDMHRKTVEALGYPVAEVRTPSELKAVDALIIPGGESSTMRKLMALDNLAPAIKAFAQTHRVMGTCAGLILLSNEITGHGDEDTLGLIDCTTVRNAYGRQYHSFRQEGEITLGDTPQPFEMIFIRAPKIAALGEDVEVLGTLNGEPTLIRQGNVLAMTFHPELSGDGAIHQYFLTHDSGRMN